MTPARPQSPTIGADDLAWLNGLIDRARHNAEHLDDGMIRFIDDMLVKVEDYGERTFFSRRQRSFAKTIEATLDHAGVSRNPEDWE